jgi:hypothetical protein
MGQWALESLCHRIARGREPTAGQVGGKPGTTVRLPVALVRRASTAAVSERSR